MIRPFLTFLLILQLALSPALAHVPRDPGNMQRVVSETGFSVEIPGINLKRWTQQVRDTIDLVETAPGFDGAILLAGLNAWEVDGDRDALRTSMNEARLSFVLEHGFERDQDAFFATLGFVPVIGTSYDGYQMWLNYESGDYLAMAADGTILLISLVPLAGPAVKLLRRGADGLDDAELDRIAREVAEGGRNGTVVFDDTASAAANRLGFDPADVTVTNGVADVPIIFTSSVSPSDLTRVTSTLREQGVTSVRIDSGPIINDTITTRLARSADEGRTFMGFNVVRTGDPNNMFVLERSLQ